MSRLLLLLLLFALLLLLQTNSPLQGLGRRTRLIVKSGVGVPTPVVQVHPEVRWDLLDQVDLQDPLDLHWT